MAATPTNGHQALREVIDALRAGLRDLDDQQVPASLRRVVAHTSKRLPPPLLRSLLLEMDRNEWLREKLLEEVGESPPPELVSFLERPPGWWLDIADRAAQPQGNSDTTAALEGQVQGLESKLDEAKRRIAKLHRAESAARTDLKEVRGRLRSAESQQGSGDETLRLRALIESQQAQLDDAERRRAAAEDRLADMQRRIRTKDRNASPRSSDARTMGFDDPVDVARRLDLQVASLSAAVRAGVDLDREKEAGPPPELPRLPAGVAPDSVESIRWVLAVESPLSLVVDGYNVTFLLDSANFVTSDLRRRLVGEVERLVRNARAAHRAVVVFDSDLVDGDQPGLTPGGVEVRFSVAEDSADDAIVALAQELPVPVVVITNDRELRERAALVGAEALWGGALADWINE